MFGQKFYFSYGTDVTLTQQRWVSIYGNAEATNKPMWANADKRFWWNRFLTQPFTGVCLLVRSLPIIADLDSDYVRLPDALMAFNLLGHGLPGPC